MTPLRPCPACKRHVATREITCPFCASALSPAPAQHVVLLGRVSRAAVFSAALAACSKEPAKQPPPAPAQGSDDLEELLDYQPRVADQPDAAPPPRVIDAAVEQVATPVDAGVPDAGVTVTKKKKKRQQDQQQTIHTIDQTIDRRHLAKPYGAPPARRRIV